MEDVASDAQSAERDSLSTAATAALRGGVSGSAVAAGLSGETLTAQSLLAMLGGVRGLVETTVPGVLFLVAYVFTQDARLSAIMPLAVVAIGVLIGLLQRRPLMPVLFGAAGVALAAALTLFTGKGSAYYVPGFIVNTAWIAALLISLTVRWPLLGLVYGAFRGSFTEWRADHTLRRVSTMLTLVWLGMFVARLAVQLPLFWADAVQALGVARLVMGTPLFALVVAFTWVTFAKVARAEAARAESGAGGL